MSKILLIENNENLVTSIKANFSGDEIVVAKTVEEALNILESTDFDHIIMSVQAHDHHQLSFSAQVGKTRLKTRLRQRPISNSPNQIIKKGALTLDVRSDRACLNRGGEEIPLDMTPFALRLLFFFAENEGALLSRDFLIEKTWGHGTCVSARTLDAHISKIRRHLKDSGYTIKAVYGEGYVFCKSAAPQHINAA